MKLKKLEIEFKEWGPMTGRYVGEIEYAGETGKVCMTLSPDVSNKILIACGDNILRLAGESAEQFRQSISLSIAEAKQGPALTA